MKGVKIMTKMTKKDYFNAVISLLDYVPFDNIDADLPPQEDIIKFCKNEIDLLAKKSAKAKDKAAEKKAKMDDLTVAILNFLDGCDEPATINTIVAAVGDAFPDITNAKVSSRLSPLVKAGTLTKTEITVAREKGKAKLVAYSKVVNND